MMTNKTFMTFLAVGALLVANSLRANDEVDTHESTASSPATEVKKPVAEQSRREGDTIEAIGHFELTGDRVTFYTEVGEESFRVVENLALERVARVLEDPSGFGKSRQWSIAAKVLEYRGTNYLMLERAVLKGRKTGSK